MSAVAAVKNVGPQHSGLVEALIAAKREFGPLLKNSINPHFKNRYVDLDGVIEACDEALGNHGLAVIQKPRYRDGITLLVTELRHVSGETEESEYPLLPAKANDPQALGACMTYARRYCYMAMLSIAPTDDDGNEASGRVDNGPKAPQRAQIRPTTIEDIEQHMSKVAAQKAQDEIVKSAARLAAPVAAPTPVATEPSRVTIKQVQQLQIAIKELSLGGDTADEKRANRIAWVRWASGQEGLESTSDLLATNFDKVLAKARNGEAPVLEVQLGGK